MAVSYAAAATDHQRLSWLGGGVMRPRPDGWEVSPEVLARASEATGQTVLGPPLDVDSSPSLQDFQDPYVLRT